MLQVLYHQDLEWVALRAHQVSEVDQVGQGSVGHQVGQATEDGHKKTFQLILMPNNGVEQTPSK